MVIPLPTEFSEEPLLDKDDTISASLKAEAEAYWRKMEKK